METKKIENSSQVDEIGYSKEDKIFMVVYKNGAKYHYFNVPQEVWDGAQSAESVGSYVHKNVKGYSYKRV